MLLVIDNYDSFTYNLVQYLGELGAELDGPAQRRRHRGRGRHAGARGIVISPGPCTPAEAGVTVPVIRAGAAEIPMLGVCLGHQAIAEAYGGTVVRAGR
jgi:anthranilate synthase component II